MHLSTVSEWLAFISRLHSKEIDLSLDRVKKVAKRLDVLTKGCPVIIVAGTNGKGSTVAGLESIYRAAHYKTGAFTSPFLFRYNEQIRINGQMIEDETLCTAFKAVEAAREDVSLTPFEFGTLAAFVLFKQHALDVWIIEVGLGGRLDAVNILDADVSVVTSIAIDHVDFLGDTREEIAIEKAGIFRKGKPAVCGDKNPPVTLRETAKNISAPFYQCGLDFNYQESSDSWSFTNGNDAYHHLPRNHLATHNMAIVLEVIHLLQLRLPVKRDAIDKGLKQVELLGRIQTITGPVLEIYDVSHNPAAIEWLSDYLSRQSCSGKTIAVFSMLEDKDVVASILTIKNKMDVWHVAPLTVKRAANKAHLENAFKTAEVIEVVWFDSIDQAYKEAIKITKPGDRIIVFGSFHTVADVLKNKEK